MKNANTSRKQKATADVDPATLARQQLLERQRFNMKAALLKRRRRKSGQ